MRAIPLLLAAALLLAGCAKEEEPVATSAVLPGIVQGVATDLALTPLAGVNVTVDGANLSALTDAAGAFRFVLPPGEHVLLASLDGHKNAALRASVASEQTSTLAFTMEALPKLEPYAMAQEGKGLLGCRALLVANGERTLVPCGAQDPNERTRLDFPVDATSELGGAVVEAVWTPTSQAGRSLTLTVSRASGEELVLLAASEADGHASIALPARLLSDVKAGDILVAQIEPAGSLTDEEANADGAVLVQQPFTVYVTLFYRQDPPASYSALDASA